MSPSRTAAIGPADKCLGRNMTRGESARRAAEAPVSEQRHLRTQLRIRADGRCHLQHLAHARPALRPFVANHHHIAGLDAACLHNLEAIFFRVKHARGPAMVVLARRRNLHHAAFRREVAFQNHQATIGLDGLFESGDDVLARSLFGSLPLLRPAFCRSRSAPIRPHGPHRSCASLATAIRPPPDNPMPHTFPQA